MFRFNFGILVITSNHRRRIFKMLLVLWMRHYNDSAWNGRPWPGRSQNWMLMYFIINLSGSQQFSGSSIQNQVELSEWATSRFMHCNNQLHLQKAPSDRPMSMSLRCFVRAIRCVASLVISTEVCLHGHATTSRVQQPILTILSNFAIVAKLGNPRCL